MRIFLTYYCYAYTERGSRDRERHISRPGGSESQERQRIFSGTGLQDYPWERK